MKKNDSTSTADPVSNGEKKGKNKFDFEIVKFLVTTLVTVILTVWGTLYVGGTIKEQQSQELIAENSEYIENLVQFTRDSSLIAAKIATGFPEELLAGDLEKYANRADELYIQIFSHGSETTVKLFAGLCEDVRENTVSVETFFTLPLMISQMKYETTGQIINPKIIQENLMPELTIFQLGIQSMTNDLIEEYDLSDKFKWE